MEKSLLEVGCIKESDPPDGPRHFVWPGANTVVAQNEGESAEEHLMDEETLIDEEGQVDQATVIGEEDPDQEGRVTEEYQNAEESRIAQQYMDYTGEWISRAFEYFGESLPRGVWGRGARR
ncbi:hypothetical protein CCMA1212_008306 [Trichoderma ghanense]|uniref:Uncharacterized protein n=1 Tax=Trichoderma ghanense TaxID=65468 RepID=A0ABY2GVV4_9HYPO